MNYVLDASVVIKWFREEQDRDKSLFFRDGLLAGEFELFESDLLFYEITNVLKTKSKALEKSTKKLIELVFQYRFSIVYPSKNLFDLAIRLAFHHKITIYDAIYLALAHELKCVFVTADEKLFNKVKSQGKIKLLKKLKVDDL